MRRHVWFVLTDLCVDGFCRDVETTQYVGAGAKSAQQLTHSVLVCASPEQRDMPACVEAKPTDDRLYRRPSVCHCVVCCVLCCRDRKIVDAKPLAPVTDAGVFANAMRKGILRSGWFAGARYPLIIPTSTNAASLLHCFTRALSPCDDQRSNTVADVCGIWYLVFGICVVSCRVVSCSGQIWFDSDRYSLRYRFVVPTN